MKVTFGEYWNTFFCWAGELEKAKKCVIKKARYGYKEYCNHINQKELLW